MPNDPMFYQYIFSKLGIIKNPLLVYGIIAALILLTFGSVSDPPLRSTLMIGGMTILLSAPLLWFVAYIKLPSTAQERAFEANTSELVNQHKNILNENPPSKGDNS